MEVLVWATRWRWVEVGEVEWAVEGGRGGACRAAGGRPS